MKDAVDVVFVVAVALAALTASGHAVIYKRDSRSAAIWVLVIWILPALGPVAYAVLGVNRVVFGTVNANLRHYHAAADSLSHANRAWLDHLITRRVKLKDWDEAYEKREGDVKTVLLFED